MFSEVILMENKNALRDFPSGNALLKEEAKPPYFNEGKGGKHKFIPSVPPGDDIGAWPFIWRAIWLLQRGALLPACRDMQKVRSWREQYLESIVESVPADIFLNAMAEFMHNDYNHSDHSLDMVFSMLLGRHALKWKGYFYFAPCFATRVVGLRYEDRWANACTLKQGTLLVLIHETDNPHDSNAIHVYAKGGLDLGYLRRTLAATIALRMAQGQKFKSYAGIVLGSEFDLDERVHIWIEQAE